MLDREHSNEIYNQYCPELLLRHRDGKYILPFTPNPVGIRSRMEFDQRLYDLKYIKNGKTLVCVQDNTIAFGNKILENVRKVLDTNWQIKNPNKDLSLKDAEKIALFLAFSLYLHKGLNIQELSKEDITHMGQEERDAYFYYNHIFGLVLKDGFKKVKPSP